MMLKRGDRKSECFFFGSKWKSIGKKGNEWDIHVFEIIRLYSYCHFEMLQVMSLPNGEGVSMV